MSRLCQRNHRHHCNDRSLSNTLSHPLPRSCRLFPSCNVSFSLCLSLSTNGSYRCCFPTLAEHSSLTGHWSWTGMIQLADHGCGTSTVPPKCLGQTHTGPRRPLHLCCQGSAKPRGKFLHCVDYQSYTVESIPVLVYKTNVTK